MRIAACFIYVLATLIYTSYTGIKNNYVYLFGQATILLFILALAYFMKSERANTVMEDKYISFCMYLTGARLIYTAVCVFMPVEWIHYNTLIFNFLLGTSFVVLLIHSATYKP